MRKLDGSEITALIVMLALAIGWCVFICLAVRADPGYEPDEIQDCHMEEGKLILDFKNGNRVVTDQFTITVHQ